MKPLYLPAKYKGHGLHIRCSICNKYVTSNPCKHADKQRFMSKLYNPLTKKQNRLRSYKTRDPEEAFALHLEFRTYLKNNNYDIPRPQEKAAPAFYFIKDAAKMYLDYLQDIGVPKYEKKNLTPGYILDQTRYITRFLKAVQKVERRISSFPIDCVNENHVAKFDESVRDLELSQTSYNSHMSAGKYFFKWVIRDLEIEMKNPFEKVKLRTVRKNPEIIPFEEINLLFSVITPENGVGKKGKKKVETVNYYRPWLKRVLLLALLTGERRDGLVLLKWTDIKGHFLQIPNWKVNRIMKQDFHYTYTPMTKDLAKLLSEFPKSSDEDYIIVPEYKHRQTLKEFISKAFSHYWKVAGLERKVTFRHLRKTYITRLTELIGERALRIKHNEDVTAIKHYLDQKQLMSQTKDLTLYEISGLL